MTCMRKRPQHRHDPRVGLKPGTPCPNCETPLAGTWCFRCGQKWAPLDPAWHDLLHEATHEFLHLDGKIFRTLRLLLFQPGELTAAYLRGHRARYIGALRLYLTMSLIYFVLSAVIPNVNLNPGSSSEAKHTELEPINGTATDFLSRVAAGRRVAQAQPERFEEIIRHTFPKVMFAFVPLFAVLLKMLYRNRHRNYPQFLYFSLHVHAAVFTFLSCTLPLQTFASDTLGTAAQGVVLFGAFLYLITALKRVFGGRTLQAFLRASAVTGAYLLALAASVAFVVVLLFYRLGQSDLSH